MKFTARLTLMLSCAACPWASASVPCAAPSPAFLQLAQETTIALAAGQADGKADAPADTEKTEGVVLTQGKIKAIARPPKPRSVPYKDAVIALHLVDVEALDGKRLEKEILVFMWGMCDNKWTAGADYRVGQTIRLSLRPWDEVAAQYGAYHRIELEGEEVFLLEPYWGEAVVEPPPA